MSGDAGRLASGLSVRHPLEGPFRPSLPFVLSEYLTAEERRQEKMRRKFEVRRKKERKNERKNERMKE